MATRRVGSKERSDRAARVKAEAPEPAVVADDQPEAPEPVAAAAAVAPPKRNRAVRRSAPTEPLPMLAEAPQAVSALDAGSATAITSVVTLEAGLNVVEVTGPPALSPSDDDVLIPMIRVCEWPSPGSQPLTILSETGVGDVWVRRAGGVVVVGTPSGGGRVAVTVFGAAEEAVRPATIAVRRLHGGEARPDIAQVASSAVELEPTGREIAVEILMHIEREGDRQLPGQGWVGPRGQRKRVEAFGIRPLGGLWPRDIHYKALQAGGVETPWTPGPQLCGTRGRGLPLLGFAIRVAPHLESKFDVVYQGAFFNSGIVGPSRNGEPCRPPISGDPLEALLIRIIERPTE